MVSSEHAVNVTLRRRELLLGLGLTLFLGPLAAAAPAVPRRLKLKNEHTGEAFDGWYRDEEGPIPSAISDLAYFLRDFHVDRVHAIDVDVLDFLDAVITAIGAESGLVLSGYRTPETNAMLARTTFGVAENSQHLLGRAIDVTFPARLEDAERAARAMERGGVGWYPQSHFIHLDSGPVRNWELGNGSGAELVQIVRGSWGRRNQHLPIVCRRLVCTPG